MPLSSVPDKYLNLVLDAAAEKNKRIHSNVPAPMVKPEDLGQDFAAAPQVPEEYNPFDKTTVEVPRQKTPQENSDEEFRRNSENYNMLRDAGQLPGQDIPGGADTIKRGPADFTTGTSLREDIGQTPLGKLYFDTYDFLTKNRSGLPSEPSSTAITPNAPLKTSEGATAENIIPTTPESGTTASEKPLDYPVRLVGAEKAPQVGLPEKSAATDEAVKEIGSQKIPTPEERKPILEQQANAAIAAKKTEMDFYEDISNTQPDLYKRYSDTMNKLRETEDNVKNFTKIDPNRVWNQGSVGNKISFLISAAFGGLQNGGALKNLIDNDIAAQVKDQQAGIEGNRGLLNVFIKQGEDLVTAIQNTRLFGQKYVQAANEFALLKIQATPESLNQRAQELYNKDISIKAKQNLEAGALQNNYNKLKQETAVENAKLKSGNIKTQLEAQIANQKVLNPTEEGIKAQIGVQQYGSGIDKMTELERGLSGVKLSSVTTNTILNRIAASHLGKSATSATIDSLLSKILPDDVKNNPNAGKIEEYYRNAIQTTLAEMNTGRYSEDKFDKILKTNTASAFDNPESLNKLQQSRVNKHKLYRLQGGPAANKVVQKNK